MPADSPQPHCLLIEPASLEFRELQASQLRSALLTIKNVGSRVHGVRVRPFTSAGFQLRGFTQGTRLAPGLALTCEVVCTGGEADREFHDKLLVLADDGSKQAVPCHALPPQSDVTMTGDLHFGVVLHESLSQRAAQLANSGAVPVTFRVEADGALPVRVTPAEGQLGPSGTPEAVQQLRVDFTADSTGPVSGKLSAWLGAQEVPLTLDLTATVMAHTFELIDAQGAAVTAVSFGAALFGDVLSRQLVLINNGPKDARFFSACGSPKDFQDAGDAALPAEDSVGRFLQAARLRGSQIQSSEARRFELQPLNAIVPAYGRTTLSVVFKPGQLARPKGFAASTKLADEQFTYAAQLTFDGYPQELKFVLRGEAVEARLKASRPSLVFGSVPTHGAVDQQLVLGNQCTALPAHFRIPRHPYFHCIPSEGSIVPGATCAVLVTYRPKALGRHDTSLQAQVLAPHSNAVVSCTTVELQGRCERSGPAERPLGGTGALPESFVRPRAYVDESKALQQTLGTLQAFQRQQPWDDPVIRQHFEEMVPAGSKQTYSLQDLQRHVAHNDRYTSMLRAKRTRKQHREAWQDDTLDTKNLGMHPYRGLAGPEGRLPHTPEGLWLDKSAAAVRPQNCPAMPPEALADVPLHKDKPSTDAEAAQCTEPLSKQDLQRVSVGPRMLDFGRISACSSNHRCLVVSNPLPRSIHVLLAAQAVPELSGTETLSQVVPPGAAAKFAISLMVPHVQSFVQRVEYVINGCQFFSFEVRAEVVPVSLEVSEEELSFAFSLDNWQPYVEQVLVLSNTQPFSAEFKWQLDPAAAVLFSVSPAEGIIKGSNSLQCTVRWQPGPDATPGEQLSTMQLVLKGGSGMHTGVQLRAQLPEGKLSFKDKALALGGVPVGVPQTAIVVLRNTGTHDGNFQTLQNEIVRCNPDRGRVPAGGSLDLELTLNFLEPQQVQTRLDVEVRGGKPVKLPITAEAVLPSVDIREAQLAFGEVYMGVTMRLPLTIVNTSPVPASVNFDLFARPEFSLELPKENWSTDMHDDCPLLRMGRRGSAGSSRSSRRMKPSEAEELAKASEGARYQLKMLASESFSLFLVFSPRREAKHNFDLQAMLVGYGFSVTGVRARMHASRTMFDFGKSIVIRAHQLKPPYSLEVALTSNEAAPIAWQFGPASTESMEGGKGVFATEPSRGTLQPGTAAAVQVLFMPKDGKTYQGRLPVYLDGQTAQPYFTFEVRGEGEWPRLKFDMRECILPSVPLGVRADAQFHVINDGYDNLEMKTRLPADEHHLPLAVAFPEGSLIGIVKDQLPVMVSCMATRPTSFTANVDFLDEDGKRYSLPVTGVADASLLTIQPFMEANAAELLWRTSEAGPVSLDDSVPYVLPEAGLAAIGPTSPSPAVSKLLTAITGRGPFSSLPAEIVASKGRLMLELTELLSGKPVPNKAGNLTGNRKEAAQLLLTQYDGLLTFLKSHGCLLNAVKPELLLDIEEFRTVLAKRDAKVVTEADAEEMEWWYQLEDDYEINSFKAWNAVTHQVLKVFVLGRVTLKSFKALPGLEGCQLPPDTAIVGSNVYSTAESVLLAWLTVHFRKVLPMAARRITNFASDLQDGLALYAALVSHWPGLAKLATRLKTAPADDVQLADNAGIVVKLLETLQLPFAIQAQDILKPNAFEMLIFVLYLYQALPQLIPRATVEFVGKLQEKQVKYIELSNPASKPIAYAARLEGHPDFSLEVSTIRMEAKASVQVAVHCKSSTTNPQTAKLVLLSKRSGTAPAATMVFALSAEVDARGPLKRIKAEAQLYEFRDFDIRVTNPFQADCEFTVRVVHTAAADLDLARLAEGGHRRGVAGGRVKKGTVREAAEGREQIFPHAFGVDRTRVRMKANAEETLKGAFLPFTLEPHVCCIMFEDLQCGKFVYEVTADTKPPPVFKEFKFQVPAEGAQSRDILLPWANSQIDAARRAFLDRHPNNKHKDQVQLAKGEGEAGVTCITFNIERSSARLETLSTLALFKSPSQAPKGGAAAAAAEGGAAAGAPADGPGANLLRVVLHPVGAGQYPCRVLLHSSKDVRLLDIEFTAIKTGQAVALEFDCPAREKVVQEIPVVNPGVNPMQVTADCRGEAFSGPRSLEVPPGQTVGYPLAFSAPWIGDYAGGLEMTLPSGEHNTYTLLGRAGDPVAEGHLVLECEARTHLGRRVAVPNVVPLRPAEYRVFSDLECVGGRESVRVEPGATGSYTLHVLAPRPGVLQGSITFMAESGHYVWYYLTINVAEAPPVAELEVSATVRQAVAVQLSISNPLREPSTFEVAFGSDMLVGPSKATLEGQETKEFEFFFSPLVAGDSQAEIVFSSFKLGNFRYTVRMRAEGAPAETLPELSAQLGTTVRHTVEIRNPAEYDAVLEVSSSNAHNFAVAAPVLVLPGFGSAHLAIDYLPSSLGTLEQGTITLHSAAVGAWEYACSGQGRRPDVMEATTLSAILLQDGSSFVSWRNPFAEPVKVDVSLTQEGDSTKAADAGAGEEEASTALVSNCFELVLKKTRGISVGPYGMLQVPITFRAVCLEVHRGEVQVAMDTPLDAQPLVWRYPLQGMSEAETSTEVHRFTCQARSHIEGALELRLEGLGRLSGQETFSHEVVLPPGKQSALGNALQLTQVAGSPKQPDEPLRYKVSFAPQKTVKANVGLIITKSNGGRWRFELRLEATQPEVDGSITLAAAPGESAVAPVMLYSPTNRPMPFTCHFTHDSSIQFDMQPSEGVLPAQRALGLKPPEPPIMVKYFAKGYGKAPVGKLVVLTEDAQWTYVIHGVQPAYVPPNKAKLPSGLDNALAPQVQARLEAAAAATGSKNFLVHNAAAMRRNPT